MKMTRQDRCLRKIHVSRKGLCLLFILFLILCLLSYEDVRDPHLASFVGNQFQNRSKGSVQKSIHVVPNMLMHGVPNKKLTHDISNKTVNAERESGAKLYDIEESLSSSHNTRNNRVLLKSLVEDSKPLPLTSIWKDTRTALKDIHNTDRAMNKDESRKKDALLGVQQSHLMNRMTSQRHNTSWTDNLDLLKLKPFKFLPNYKNPCWKTNNPTVPISCLPYFYLVGAPKAGTTDVFARLRAHPEFARPPHKEPHWITRRRFRPGTSSIYYYIHFYFGGSSKKIYRTRDDNGYHRLITGDCSASTLFDNFNWRMLPHPDNAEEPEHTNADYLHHINPNTRIIVILRDPVSRLYSDFLYFNKNASQSKFHNAVTRAIEWQHQCQETYSLRSCLYDKRGFQLEEPMARMQIGIYHIHLQEFFRVFPRDQILILKLEDYSKSPEAAMKKIFGFLDLSDSAELKLDILQNISRHANERREKDKEKGQMWKITQDLLRDFHKPHNDALAKLLQDDHFNYNDMYS